MRQALVRLSRAPSWRMRRRRLQRRPSTLVDQQQENSLDTMQHRRPDTGRRAIDA
jgi:hypothetical protein